MLAVGLEDPGRGSISGGELPDAIGGAAQQGLALEASQRRAEAALWGNTQGRDVQRADEPPQLAGVIGVYPLPLLPPGLSPSGSTMIAPAQSLPKALRMP